MAPIVHCGCGVSYQVDYAGHTCKPTAPKPDELSQALARIAELEAESALRLKQFEDFVRRGTDDLSWVLKERDQAQRDNARLREVLEYLRDHELTPKQVEDRAREALAARPQRTSRDAF